MKSLRRRRACLLPLSSLCLLCLTECRKPKEPASDVVRPIKMLQLDGDVTLNGEFPGKITARVTSEMGFEVAGKITEIPIKEGQSVKKGAIIARIDPRDYDARLASARAKLREAQLNFQRAKDLYSADSIALAEVDRRRTEFELAQTGVREASKAREETMIRAPFDGVVARKLVKEFSNVEAKQPVVILQDDSHLEIDISVSEQAWATTSDLTAEQLNEQLKPIVEIASLPGKHFSAKLKEAASVADAVTRTFKVTFMFEKPEGMNVLPGMSAKVVIKDKNDDTSPDKMLSIPSQATLSADENTSYVWVVDRATMTVSKKRVELGKKKGENIEVLGGLQGSEWIATSGIHLLQDGMKVSHLKNKRY